MSNVFERESSEVFLVQIQDTGVGGGTLSIRMHGKHIFFEMKSPLAIMTILTNRVDDLKKMRGALKRAIILHEGQVTAENVERVTRTQADIRLAEGKQGGKSQKKAGKAKQGTENSGSSKKTRKK